MKPSFILDFETLSPEGRNCVFVNCSYFIFDFEKFLDVPYTYEYLIDNVKTFKFDCREQLKKKYVTDNDTMNFWKQQPEKVKAQILPSSNDQPISKFYEELSSYISKEGPVDLWWSRSNAFDPVILWRMFKDFPDDNSESLQKSLKYWKVRDIRTFIDTSFDFNLNKNDFVPVSDEKYWQETHQKHISAHDVAADIMRMQSIVRVSNGMEMTNR